jgi:hypothetical protein
VKVSVTGSKTEIQAKKAEIVKALIKDLNVNVQDLLKAEHSHNEDPLKHKTIRDLHEMEREVIDEEYKAMLAEITALLGDA